MVTDTALYRATAQIVLYSITGEDLSGTIVHLHREVDRQLPLGHAQNSANIIGQIQHLGGPIELSLRDVERINLVRRHCLFLFIDAIRCNLCFILFMTLSPLKTIRVTTGSHVSRPFASLLCKPCEGLPLTIGKRS